MSTFKVPADLRYTQDHEWARDEGDGVYAVGITDFAQDALGDITFVELPEVGRTLESGDGFGVVESVKTFSDLYAPMPGEVVEVNEAVVEDPSLINREVYTEAWLVKIRVTDAAAFAGLMDAAAYTAHMKKG